MKALAAFATAAMVVFTACAFAPAARAPHVQETETCGPLRILEQSGPLIDYDTLMHVYAQTTRNPDPVHCSEPVLEHLIPKRNQDPRIDQMILIYSARIIGESRKSIPNVENILLAILEQEERLNEWVIAFVADAIGDYPFDLTDGDLLVDLLEAKLERIRSKDRSGEEYFGFHFLPPPKSLYIQAYIAGIENQHQRVQERNRYYWLIQQNIDEAVIETAMHYLKRHGAPDSGEACRLLLECLVRHIDRVPFE